MSTRLPIALLLALVTALVGLGCASNGKAHSSTAAHRAAKDGSTPNRPAGGELPNEGSATSLDFVEYRVQPELGQISIFTGTLYGSRTIERAEKSAEALTREGILVSAGDAPRMLHRTDTMNGKKFETLVLAAPPDPEMPEAGWTRRLLLTVDGKLKIDCSLGDAGLEADLFVYGVQLFPEDATLCVTASDNDGQVLTVPDEVASLDDETVLNDDAFEGPADEEPEPDVQSPMRV